jgi:DNA-binding IscR family transcriptional regulator
MDEVVLALEGGVAPMTCFMSEDGQSPISSGRVVCNHEADSGHGCATKLLWTRVQGGVVKALAQTTLAELVGFSNRTIPTSPTTTSALTVDPVAAAMNLS